MSWPENGGWKEVGDDRRWCSLVGMVLGGWPNDEGEERETGREREGERVCVCWWKKKENENDPMQHDLPITINILNIIYQFLGLKTWYNYSMPTNLDVELISLQPNYSQGKNTRKLHWNQNFKNHLSFRTLKKCV